MNHTCVNTCTTVDGSVPPPCEACRAESAADPVGFVLSRCGMTAEFKAGREFERWLHDESDTFHRSYGRAGNPSPETDDEVRDAFRKWLVLRSQERGQ